MKNLKANLPKGEQKVMEEFAKRKNILIITDASKDSAVVIMDVEKQQPTANYLINATTRCYKMTQRYNTVIWFMT